MDLEKPVLQKDFAELVGVSESAVSQWVADGVLKIGETLRTWILLYCSRLRAQAAGRGAGGPLDLAQERAALARAQRAEVELRIAIKQGEFAPIWLLADVLATASGAVSDRLDQIPGHLQRACPDLPSGMRDEILKVIASAREECLRQSEQLVLKSLDDLTDVEEDRAADLDADSPAV